MKLKILIGAAIVAITVAAILLSRSASAQEAGPTAGELLADGLSATGAAVGPDGALYVPTGGTGGDQVLDPPPEAGFEGEVTFGLTSTIERVDPETGAVTTEAENLPSVAVDGEGAGVIADVAFLGNTMYFLLTGSADALGVEDWPNGVYEVTGGGTDAELVADISAFNEDNPVDFPDAVPGGNPFALEPRGTGFIVSDGNYNRLLNVTTAGNVSLLVEYDNVVPTGLASRSSGPVLNTWFSPAPHTPGSSHVVSVAVPGGAVTELASGPASMIDVTFGPNGNTYVLQFSDFAADETAPPTPTGRIYRLESDGTLTLLVEGFVLSTSLNFDGDTAFVTTLTGQVWKIENFSSIQPITRPAPTPTVVAPAPTQAPAQPTATRPAGIVAPDTGGGSAGADDARYGWLAALVAAGALLSMGGAAALRRR